MQISTLLRIVLVIEIIALLGATMAVARDYQDSWILEGLEIPFIIFIATYVAYSFVEDRISWILIFAVIVRCVFLIIPNLKYVWFQGVAYDQNIHYRLYQTIFYEGFVPNTPLYNSMLYLHTPLMHILFSIFTHITAFPPLVTFKYLPILSWLPYPLIVYLIMKNAAPEDHKSQKYALLISSIPIKSTLSYNITGTLFGALFTVMLFVWFIHFLQATKRNRLIVVLIYIFALVFTHSYSPVILIIGLLTTYVLYKTKYVRNNYAIFESFGIQHLLIVIIIFIFWFAYVAKNVFGAGVQIFNQWITSIAGISATSTRTYTDINPALFGLSLENQLRIIIVYYGADLFIMLLTLVGIIVTIKRHYSSKPLIFITLYLLSTWSFFIFQLILPTAKAGILEFNRIFEHSMIFAPIFIGLLLSHIHKKAGGKKLNSLALSFLVVLATVELYRYQPLLPIASSIRPGLPSDEYIIYVDNVNSVYQRYMIAHAEKHISNGIIACDPTTYNQILGLTDYDFSQHHSSNYYPFDGGMPKKEFDYFLTHLPGKSGWLRVRPEVGTRDFIVEVTLNSSMIYSNGESFILTSPFMYRNTTEQGTTQ